MVYSDYGSVEELCQLPTTGLRGALYRVYEVIDDHLPEGHSNDF